jgi:molybdenum cofactor biosynthesis enzyme MoaA
MNDVGFPVARVLEGIQAAADTGLTPVKVNMVVKRHVNDHAILAMAERFRHSGHILRFIEYMDVGTTNGWRLDDVVTAEEIRSTIDANWPLEPLRPNYPGEVANRYRYRDNAGEIGLIASVTQPFCGNCTRARPSADGKLHTASSPAAATTSAPSCAAEPPTRNSHNTSSRSGPRAPTATPKHAPPKRPKQRRSRCPTSAADSEAPASEGCDSRTRVR